jgi:hypothetical protein
MYESINSNRNSTANITNMKYQNASRYNEVNLFHSRKFIILHFIQILIINVIDMFKRFIIMTR